MPKVAVLATGIKLIKIYYDEANEHFAEYRRLMADEHSVMANEVALMEMKTQLFQHRRYMEVVDSPANLDLNEKLEANRKHQAEIVQAREAAFAKGSELLAWVDRTFDLP